MMKRTDPQPQTSARFFGIVYEDQENARAA